MRYSEKAVLENNGRCVITTYKNGTPYNWRGRTQRRPRLAGRDKETPYSFIPMVLARHMSIGLNYGGAEPHALITQALEVDDMALSDGRSGTKKRVQAPKLLSGMKALKGPLIGTKDQSNEEALQLSWQNDLNHYWSEQGRQMMPFLYGPESAKPHDLTNDLDLPGITGHIAAINAQIELNYPEINMNEISKGDPSGRALRVARQRVESKIQERRDGYDEPLVMAQKMAIAIGAMRGYPGYEGLEGDPFEDGPLDHEIKHRPVFHPDPMDDIEEGTAFWNQANTATQAGCPLVAFLRLEGWDEADIDLIAKAKADEQKELIEQTRQRMQIAAETKDPNAVDPSMKGDDPNGTKDEQDAQERLESKRS